MIIKKKIIGTLNKRATVKNNKKLLEFNIGDLVCFKTENQEIIEEMVIRINQKTIIIVEKNGLNWRVSPTYLSKIISVQEKNKYINEC